MDDLRIGSWVVAPSLNSITSGGRTVRLEPKVMGVLLCLAKHPGETLSKKAAVSGRTAQHRRDRGCFEALYCRVTPRTFL